MKITKENVDFNSFHNHQQKVSCLVQFVECLWIFKAEKNTISLVKLTKKCFNYTEY